MKFEHPNRAKTKNNNMYHLIYIGTREGVALNDDIKEFQNKSSNDEYMKYISDRPRSHGLFGKNKNIDLKQACDYMKNYNGYVYRGIISLKETDAVNLGYDNKDKWEMLIRNKMLYMSQKLNIPYSQLDWVGAFHRESGHPHVHLMMWDKNNNIRSKGAIPLKNINEIRKELTNEIFSEERSKLLLEKNSLRELLVEGSKSISTGDFLNMGELEEKFKDIDVELMSEIEEINQYEIGNKIRNKMIEEIKEMIESLEVPREGRLQYKLMPLEVKNQIDLITDNILSSPTYTAYFEKYIDTVKNLSEFYTNKDEDVEEAVSNAKEDIFKRIGNSILNVKKDMLQENKSSNFEVQSLLNNIFKILTIKSNQNRNIDKNFSATKSQRKEMAKKLRVKGLYTERDIKEMER